MEGFQPDKNHFPTSETGLPFVRRNDAGTVWLELVDTPGCGPGAARRRGSTPLTQTRPS
jgi:hypothetical protein